NPLNQWTFTRAANEIAFTAAAGNALDWNTIYNFWFDCSVAPVSGPVRIDEARPGPGLLDVVVASQVPGPPPPLATVARFGSLCGMANCKIWIYESFAAPWGFDLATRSMPMTLSGGNYTVGAASATFVAPTGPPLALGNDSEATVFLPFVLP